MPSPLCTLNVLQLQQQEQLTPYHTFEYWENDAQCIWRIYPKNVYPSSPAECHISVQ